MPELGMPHALDRHAGDLAERPRPHLEEHGHPVNGHPVIIHAPTVEYGFASWQRPASTRAGRLRVP